MSCADLINSKISVRYAPVLTGVSCVYLLQTQISNVSSSSNGGAMYINASVSLQIRDSSFISCSCTSSSGLGGAIFADSLSSSNLYRICFYKCYCTYYFQTCRMGTSTSSPNVAKDFSMSQCPGNGEGVAYCGHFIGGCQNVSYANVSQNIPSSRVTSFILQMSNSSSLSFSTLANSKGDIVLELNSATNPQVQTVNFVNNSCYGSTLGTVFYTSEGMVSNCVFINNSQTYRFYCSSSVVLSVSGCAFDCAFSYTGVISTSNLVYGSTAIYDLAFNNYNKCLSNYKSGAFTDAFAKRAAVGYAFLSLLTLLCE